tara:strand:- start:607 stop:984 length:378 start_codon:yes stop_codon:yes gene_type:complete
MTEDEKDELAEIIANRVIDELLLVIKVRSSSNGDWVSNNTFSNEELDEINNDYLDSMRKAFDSPKKITEEDLVGEMASLMTKMSMYLDKEEYEKCGEIKKKIRKLRKQLKDDFNVDLEGSGDEMD